MKKKKKRRYYLFIPLRSALLIFIIILIIFLTTNFFIFTHFNSVVENSSAMLNKTTYPLHENITATVFWIGEPETSENDYITNVVSSWDSNWVNRYGGIDDPFKREGYYPTGFTPKENPFYFALPYNDFNNDGSRKDEAYEVVYWAANKKWKPDESMCKNRWVEITKNEMVVYGQWEDVGPFEIDDSSYVFGNSEPKNTMNDNAGIDVSPAIRDYLNLSGIDKVSWRFVEVEDVPFGPWKQVITTSSINWE